MGAVVFTMFVIMAVGGGVLAVVGWLHHLAGSVESQARVRRWRFQMLWHAYRLRLRGGSWARAARRGLATRMGSAGDDESVVDRGSVVTTRGGAVTGSRGQGFAGRRTG